MKELHLNESKCTRSANWQGHCWLVNFNITFLLFSHTISQISITKRLSHIYCNIFCRNSRTYCIVAFRFVNPWHHQFSFFISRKILAQQARKRFPSTNFPLLFGLFQVKGSLLWKRPQRQKAINQEADSKPLSQEEFLVKLDTRRAIMCDKNLPFNQMLGLQLKEDTRICASKFNDN